MKYTAPQQKLLSEGSLYGYYTRTGETEADQLINLIQGHFIDWDLNNPKFQKLFRSIYEEWVDEWDQDPHHFFNQMKDILDQDLRSSDDQNQELYDLLIAKTRGQDYVNPTAEDGRLNQQQSNSAPTGPLLSQTLKEVGDAGGVGWSSRFTRTILNPGTYPTVGDLIKQPKDQLLQHPYIGRIMLKEIIKRLVEFVYSELTTRTIKTPRFWEDVKKISDWVEEPGAIYLPFTKKHP